MLQHNSLYDIILNMYMYAVCVCVHLNEGMCHSQCFIAVKRNHDQGNSSTGKHLIGAYRLIALVHSHHAREYGIMQVNIVLKKKLRVLTYRFTGSRKRG